MPVLKVKQRASRIHSAGDRRTRIELFQRDINAPVFDNASFSELYTSLGSAWAKAESFLGNPSFDDINESEKITDVFSIRYRSDVTSETRFSYDGNYYKIVNVRDSNRRKRFLELRCFLLGDKTKAAAQ